MPARLKMQARNSSGKQVSLLNDDSAPLQESKPEGGNPPWTAHTTMARSNSSTSGISTASSPSTPGLLRSDSYDSQTTNGPVSPVTPVFLTDYGRPSSYTTAGFFKGAAPQYEERNYEYPPPYRTSPQYAMAVRPPFPDSRASSYAEPPYDEDSFENQSSERGTKRYPCRYRESHHCEKTFTTSGHASRHSKIHTAEKAVHCTYQGCQKKFTRADNMKQHLETHYKSKHGSAQKSSAKSTLTSPAGIRKPATSSSCSNRPPSRNICPSELPLHDPALYDGSATDRYAMAVHATHPGSPIGPGGTLDLGGIRTALMSQPRATRTGSSSAGLDVLANIAALQS